MEGVIPRNRLRVVERPRIITDGEHPQPYERRNPHAQGYEARHPIHPKAREAAQAQHEEKAQRDKHHQLYEQNPRYRKPVGIDNRTQRLAKTAE